MGGRAKTFRADENNKNNVQKSILDTVKTIKPLKTLKRAIIGEFDSIISLTLGGFVNVPVHGGILGFS